MRPEGGDGPDAVLFDMDGTLVDTERESDRALAEVFARRYGVALGPESLEAVLGAAWDDALRTLHGRFGIREADGAGLKAELLAVKARLLDGSPRALPGAVQAVRAAASRWPVAVVTGSWREEAEGTLHALGLRALVGAVVGSEDVVRGKPAPEGYRRAAAALGARPERCLVLEDSVRGVAAGRAAGAVVAAVLAGSLTPAALGDAHTHLDSLEGVDADGLLRLYSSGKT